MPSSCGQPSLPPIVPAALDSTMSAANDTLDLLSDDHELGTNHPPPYGTGTTDLAETTATPTVHLPNATDPTVSATELSPPSISAATSTATADAEVFVDAEDTPSLPPRPDPGSMSPPVQEVPTNLEEHDAPEVASLRAMFPDFDSALLQSVLDSVHGDQDRAIDALLGMSDPNYVSTQAVPPAQASLDLDEQLARQLMLQDQEQQQQHRALGQSWPRRDQGDVPYQTRQHAPPHHPQPEDSGYVTGSGRGDFQELQKTMGQIAESGKRTFSSIVSKVKAKINEYDAGRSTPSSSTASTTPQWGSAPPPQLDRHAAQQTCTATISGSTQALQEPSRFPHKKFACIRERGTLIFPPSDDRYAAPPPTSVGSPINPAKLGLLPKRPVSLMTSQPPTTQGRHDDDDEDLEYVENPFEEK
ncbi:hypothetical protein A0H81_09333 [Grifola frondosa]|uniref:CUE domain-containing protein n=1 Tax=Grifola frondosa TaxID=5627 RepID=A0A1C7M1Y3_GRIFR|nr:hypothetical protein A0H81_09333 [Grifola frondosa]